MLRVTVYEVDEHGEEKLFLDNEGNPVVKEGEGLVMVTQTAETVDGGIKADGNVCLLGKIHPLAMGTSLNEHEMLRKWMVRAALRKAMKALMLEEEKKEE